VKVGRKSRARVFWGGTPSSLLFYFYFLDFLVFFLLKAKNENENEKIPK